MSDLTHHDQNPPTADFNESVQRWLNKQFEKPHPQSQDGESEEPIVYELADRVTLPQRLSAGTNLVDFWRGIFLGGGDQFATFTHHVLNYLQESGHDLRLTPVSFKTSGVIGKARTFHLVQRGAALATLKIAHLGDVSHLYVSMRLVFRGKVDEVKAWILTLLVFVLALFPASLLFLPIWMLLGITREQEVARGFYTTTETVINETTALMALGLAQGIAVAVIGILIGLWSLWRYGDVQALVREDFDELYRDDFAALGSEIYLAVMKAQDQLDLELLDQPTVSSHSIGAGFTSNLTRRQPRI